ncbi:MAG: 50S ribosomal protein L30 [Bacteroidia bacterium]|nr:50S ribosomal protein L30 [Bacteroidia bacterium]MDW8159373.1 50S ribosomal protein L30 [Bacteroidia bacterium]
MGEVKVKVTQIKSQIDQPQRQKRTLAALGLGKINKSRIHVVNPAIWGMLNAVSHLVRIEEVKE